MLIPNVGHARRARRAGFSLVELLISMALLGLVMAALMQVITRQQRFYRGAGEIMETRSQVRQGMDILPAEFRGISASGGDIFAGTMTNTSIDFRSTFGSSTACRITSATTIAIPPAGRLAAGNTLSGWSEAPAVGDWLFIFDQGANAGASDDGWIARRITARVTTVDPCGTTSYTTAGDITKSGYTLTLDAALPTTVPAGSPVRFWRRVRYALYRASDDKPYLGYCRSADVAVQCTNLQPVSGPYRAINNSATSGQNGLNFYYFDENGAATTDRLLVARIEIALRADSQNPISRGGSTTAGVFKDTARVVVAIRNRT